MKKFLTLLLCLTMLLCLFGCSSPTETTEETSAQSTPSDATNKSENQTENTKKLLIEQDNVKISFAGISPDIGIGEGIYLFVENSRSESIIVNISEVSLNDTMQTVIQPQMPSNIISPQKNSNQPFVFPNTKLSGETVNIQFKIRVLDQSYREIFVTDFVEISF